MANDEDVARIRQGVAVWNDWRAQNPERPVDLSGAKLDRADLRGAHFLGGYLGVVYLGGADLHEADLRKANLAEANLREANLVRADLGRADLAGANLAWANLAWANLVRADLVRADLAGANLFGANLGFANLSEANLSEADLQSAILIETNLTNVDLTGCCVYGISAWDVKLEGAKQSDLVITKSDQPEITVDNLEVGQFVYLLLHNEKIRSVIDTITSKMVLILGRFTPQRKAVLDALREELRKHDYLPVLFDFDKPASKDLTGTVSTLANMARFIIADLTDPSCIPHELAMVIPTTVVPVQPILLEGMREYAMFIDLKKRHHWVLEPYSYNTQEHLIADLSERVIGPAEAKVRELRG